VPVEACLEDDLMVIRDGLCMGWFPCTQDGGVVSNRMCLEQCPDGEQANSQGFCREEGPIIIVGQCVYPEIDVGGVCTPVSEVGYEDAIDICLGQTAFDAGIDPRAGCEALVAEQCSSDGDGSLGQPASETRYCLERPCLDGGQNVDGQCVAAPSCPDGQLTDQGQCVQQTACPDGTYQSTGPGNDNACVESCADGQVAVNTTEGAQCRSQCPPGYQAIGGECTAPCPLGQAPGADGQCREITCPFPQAYAGGQCREACPSGSAFSPDGSCIPLSQCPYIVDGFCVETPPAFQDAVLLCIRGDYLSIPNRNRAACDAAVRDECGQFADASRAGGIPSHCAFPIGDPTRPGGNRPTAPDDGDAEPGEVTSPVDNIDAPPVDNTGTPPVDETGAPPVHNTDRPPVGDTGARPEDNAGAHPIGKRRPPSGPGPNAIVEYRKRIAERRPFALVIANARYSSKVIPNDRHAVGGAAAFVKYLKDDLKLPATRIVQRNDMKIADFDSLFGRPGSSTGRLQKSLANGAPSEVIIYYSGRAMAVDGGRDVVLLPRDAIFDLPVRTGYRLSDIYRKLQAAGVQRLRLYLDTAFSDPMNAQPTANAAAPRAVITAPAPLPFGVLQRPGWVVISAGTGSQPAYAKAKHPRSAFAEALLAGLRGDADKEAAGNNDGAVSLGEITAFVRDELQRTVQAATGGSQRPDAFGHPAEILAVGRSGRP
jgi:hypothetical protein